MTFSDALYWLKDRVAMRVQRSSWHSKTYIALQRPDEHSKMTNPYLYVTTPSGKQIPWLPSNDDLMADDWELAT